MHLRNQYRGLDIDELSLSERPRFQESEQLSSSVSFPRDSLKQLTLSYSCFAGISSPIHSIAVLSSLLEKGGKRRYSLLGIRRPASHPSFQTTSVSGRAIDRQSNLYNQPTVRRIRC